MEGIVKSIQGAGTFESKFGLLYKFEYEFENGTVLVANHKSQSSPFNVGDTVEYSVTGSNDYGSWGKVHKPEVEGFKRGSDIPPPNSPKGPNKGPDTNARILWAVCLKESVALLDGNIIIEGVADEVVASAVTSLTKELYLKSEQILKELSS